MALTLSVEEIVEQSKSPLLGIAPGWKRVRLGDIATIQNGAPFKSELFNKEEKGMPVIRIRDVGNAGTDTYYSGDYDPAYVVRDGDLLIGMDGDFNCARWKGPDALLNQRVCRILPKTDKYDPKLMDHALPGYLKAINEVTSSVTVKHLSSKTIADIPLPFPPLPQQRRIVEAIELQLGRLDAAVARLHAAKAKLKRYRQAVLKAAFSDGEPTRLEELCEFITKGTTPAKAMFTGNGTVPFIKVYNLTRDGSLDFTIDPTFVEQAVHEKYLARSIVYPGDLLMNIVGPPLGKVSVVTDEYPEWNINQAIVRYRTKDKLRTKYLMFYLLCDSTAQELMATTKATAGQFNLTLAHCRDLEVPLVPVEEQDFLIEHLEQRIGVIDEMESTLDAQLAQAVRLRQSVLKRAFEGRLV